METVSIEQDLSARFDQLHAAWVAERPSYRQRDRDLSRLKHVFKRRMTEMASAVSTDFGGRAIAETQLAEGMTVLSGIDYLRWHLKAWMRSRRVSPGWRLWPACAEIRPMPLGVVGVMSAWNYPVNLALIPLINAIAAGNHVFLKPSEHAPATSRFLADLLTEVFPVERVAVAQGGVEVATAFASLPFGHLLFTGSTRVGRDVMRAAAAHLTPVTLELGGKSPAIVCEDYPIERAAARLATGKWFNAGQTCIAPDYVLVDAARADALVAALEAQVRARYGDTLESGDYTSIISPAHYRRLQRYVDDARQRSLQVLTLMSPNPERCRFPPTLILDPDEDAAVMQEEIFGPVLPVLRMRSLDEGLARIEKHGQPLALYPFSHHKATIEKIIAAVPAGGVTVNDTLMHFAVDALPFGGIGTSGMGAYHGRAGFDTFSKMLPIVRQARRAASDMLKPPYSRIARLIDFIVR